MASPFCKVGRETAHEGSAISRVAEPKLVWGFTPIGAEGEGGHFPFAFTPKLYKPPARIRNFGSLKSWPAFSVRDRFRSRLRSTSISWRWRRNTTLYWSIWSRASRRSNGVSSGFARSLHAALNNSVSPFMLRARTSSSVIAGSPSKLTRQVLIDNFDSRSQPTGRRNKGRVRLYLGR